MIEIYLIGFIATIAFILATPKFHSEIDDDGATWVDYLIAILIWPITLPSIIIMWCLWKGEKR